MWGGCASVLTKCCYSSGNSNMQYTLRDLFSAAWKTLLSRVAWKTLHPGRHFQQGCTKHTVPIITSSVDAHVIAMMINCTKRMTSAALQFSSPRPVFKPVLALLHCLRLLPGTARCHKNSYKAGATSHNTCSPHCNMPCIMYMHTCHFTGTPQWHAVCHATPQHLPCMHSNDSSDARKTGDLPPCMKCACHACQQQQQHLRLLKVPLSQRNPHQRAPSSMQLLLYRRSPTANLPASCQGALVLLTPPPACLPWSTTDSIPTSGGYMLLELASAAVVTTTADPAAALLHPRLLRQL